MAKWIMTLPVLLGVDGAALPGCVKTAPIPLAGRAVAGAMAGLLCLSTGSCQFTGERLKDRPGWAGVSGL